MKKIQISIICYVMFVFDVLSRYYVRISYQSPVFCVPIRYVSTDGVGRTAWWGSMEETVVGVRWEIPSCSYICFPTVGIVVVVLLYFCVNFCCQSCALPFLQSSAH